MSINQQGTGHLGSVLKITTLLDRALLKLHALKVLVGEVVGLSDRVLVHTHPLVMLNSRGRRWWRCHLIGRFWLRFDLLLLLVGLVRVNLLADQNDRALGPGSKCKRAGPSIFS